MKILVIGGTRFFGIPMIKELLNAGHEVTVASRGRAKDEFGDKVSRIILERTDPESIKKALSDKYFDVVIDKIAYCSNDIRNLLDVVSCRRYIYMSSTAIYDPKHFDTREEEFDAWNRKLIWCARKDFPYDEIKRQAECALWQVYGSQNAVAVRYPFVVGKDDYTKRLLFYVEHVVKEMPMYIDNVDCQMGFIRSDEAGKFLAFLADKDFTGGINGASKGTISIREILAYIEKRTGKKAILDKKGEAAPYNGEREYSINTEKAQGLGFEFTKVKDWIFELIDYYIDLAERVTVNNKEYKILKLLGKGKGGYSYLVSDGSRRYVLKQIHHEPCDYYQFGNKVEAEINDYSRLKNIGIRIPQMLDADREKERILKEYITGDTIYDLVLRDKMKNTYVEQMQDMCRMLYRANTNIDYFPTNFVVQGEEMYYIDFECNDYMEEWNFENWGIRYWSKTPDFLKYVEDHK